MGRRRQDAGSNRAGHERRPVAAALLGVAAVAAAFVGRFLIQILQMRQVRIFALKDSLGSSNSSDSVVQFWVVIGGDAGFAVIK